MKKLFFVLFFLMGLSAFAGVHPLSGQMLDIVPGWSLVTLTRPIVASDIPKFLALHPMKLDPVQHSYIQCTKAEDITVGVGYWVFVKKEKILGLTHDLKQIEWETVEMTDGWNLVGVTDDSILINEGVDVIWQWQNGNSQSVFPDWQWYEGQFRPFPDEEEPVIPISPDEPFEEE